MLNYALIHTFVPQISLKLLFRCCFGGSVVLQTAAAPDGRTMAKMAAYVKRRNQGTIIRSNERSTIRTSPSVCQHKLCAYADAGTLAYTEKLHVDNLGLHNEAYPRQP